MKFLLLLSLATSAFAAQQIKFDNLGGQEQYYKGMNIRAMQPGSSTGFKNSADWDFAFGRLKNMNQGFNAVRIYSTQDNGVNHLENIFPLLKKHDLKLLIGFYLDQIPGNTGRQRFDLEFNAFKASVLKYKPQGILDYIIGVTVGNEDSYEKWTTPAVLAKQILEVKSFLEKDIGDTCTPVGHVDTWGGLVQPDAKAIVDASDFLVANIFPYWENAAITDAWKYFQSALDELDALSAGSKSMPIWLGETGWPRLPGTPDPRLNNAVASVENMKTYYTDVGCQVLNSMNSFWYIDEDAGEQAGGRPTWGFWEGNKMLMDIKCPTGTKNFVAKGKNGKAKKGKAV